MNALQPVLSESAPIGRMDVATKYRLWSEGAVLGTDTWEVQRLPEPPADGPPVVRRLSRERFLVLDATGSLDSCYVLTGDRLASLLGESLPLDG